MIIWLLLLTYKLCKGVFILINIHIQINNILITSITYTFIISSLVLIFDNPTPSTLNLNLILAICSFYCELCLIFQCIIVQSSCIKSKIFIFSLNTHLCSSYSWFSSIWIFSIFITILSTLALNIRRFQI